MGQIVASVTGALLLLKLVKILLPEGSIKKYASVLVSSLVVLVMIVSVFGKKVSLDFQILNQSNQFEPEITEKVMNRQIMKEFSKRLEADMKESVPGLENCELSFEFSETDEGDYNISSVEILSFDEEDVEIIRQIESLYSIDNGKIHWRKK